MVKKVRRNFILMTMIMLTLVLVIPLVALNLLTEWVSFSQTENNLEQIAEEEAAAWEEDVDNMPDSQDDPEPDEPDDLPEHTENEAYMTGNLAYTVQVADKDHGDEDRDDGGRTTSGTIDHFSFYTDADGLLLYMDGTEDYDEDEAQDLLDNVFYADSQSDYYENLQYYITDLEHGSLVVFTDRTSVQTLLQNIRWLSLIMFVVMEAVVFVLTMILTKRAMQPIYDTLNQQRQFISDAGHELKTPITIISANVDILEDEIGENKWLSYIRTQTDRMRTLVTEMMDLTRLENDTARQERAEFSLSEVVENTVLPFESTAYEQHKTLHMDIQPNLKYTGNQAQIEQLIGIFMDNAVKYANDNGEIRVSLTQNKDKKILKFYNTGIGVQEEEKEKIFRRFYRSDTSRTRQTGGYGLGLSIAKEIADAHKIKIHVESEPGQWVSFILTF